MCVLAFTSVLFNYFFTENTPFVYFSIPNKPQCITKPYLCIIRHHLAWEQSEHCESRELSVFFFIAFSMDPNIVHKIILLILMWRVRIWRQLEEKQNRRRYWTHPSLLRHLSSGYFLSMYGELRKYPNKVFNFTRMTTGTFLMSFMKVWDPGSPT